jgi:hypothetical protein
MRSLGSTPPIWPRLEALDGKGFYRCGVAGIIGFALFLDTY